MENNGWIKLHRKLLKTSFYKRSEVIHLFIHLLLSANHEDNNFYWNSQEIIVAKGQLITGRNSLSKQTGISIRSVRTALTILKSTSTIAIKTTNRFSLITILKWEDYQGMPTSITTSKTTNKRPSNDQLPTTNKNDKNDKNVINIRDGVTTSVHYLKNIPDIDIKQFISTYNVDEAKVKSKAEDLIFYCEAHGKKYKNYKSFLINALKRDFGLKIKLREFTK